jgi:hypothetical protein
MDNIFIYFANLPDHVKEMIAPCYDGYTIYLDSNLDEIQRVEAYNHALSHIIGEDYEKHDVNAIEINAHREGGLKL